jgi:hypothetical protein
MFADMGWFSVESFVFFIWILLTGILVAGLRLKWPGDKR